MRETKRWTYFSQNPFFLTTLPLFTGVPPVGESFCDARGRFPASGEAYGGGLRDLAASQSNGVDADKDGLVTGESWYMSLARGVEGSAEPFTGVEGNTGLGELVCAALLV